MLGQYCREVEIEVEIEPIEREGRMRIYTQVLLSESKQDKAG